MMKTAKIGFFTIIALVVSQSTSGQDGRFFSFSQPGIPTETDSVFIESKGFSVFGKIYDSSISIAGNDIFVFYSVQDTSPPEVKPPNYDLPLVTKKKSIGKVPEGDYRIITTTFSIRDWKKPPDTARIYDTSLFHVEPAGTPPPRIVGQQSCCTMDYYISEKYQKGSYYYWNGDTLSIAFVYHLYSLGDKYTSYLRRSNDTLIITLFNTTQGSATMCAAYLVVPSLSPVKLGKYSIKVILKHNFYHWKDTSYISVDHTRKGIGLSFKKPDTPEFILYPDSVLGGCWIYSPFLDTLKVLGFRPNPYFKPPSNGDSLLIGRIVYKGEKNKDTVAYKLIENWASFNKNDWSFVHVQPSDVFTYDTMSIWQYPLLKLRYSNNSGDAAKSYIYHTLDTIQMLRVPGEYPEIRLFVLPEKFDTAHSPVAGNVKTTQRISPALRIHASAARVFLELHVPPTISPAAITVNVVDIRGRFVTALTPYRLSGDGNIISAVWDRRDARGKAVASGTYFISLSKGSWRYSVTIPSL